MKESRSILIVTQAFYPEQSPRAFRASELAVELARQGHSVRVLAPFREQSAEFARANKFDFVSLGAARWPRLTLSGTNQLVNIWNRLVIRGLGLLFEYPNLEWAFKIKAGLKRLGQTHDLLISVAVPYPVHWGVAMLSKPEREKIAKLWVADCGDPYCLQENDSFKPPRYFHWVEKWFMRKADYISVPTEASKAGYFKEFHPKIKVIPQGFRFVEPQSESSERGEKLRFGYGGVFIPGKRDPREFLNFLVNHPADRDFEFHIFTTSPHLVQTYAAEDQRIILHVPIPRQELLLRFAEFDFLVNFANMGSSQTPSKLIDYAILGKPILNVLPGKAQEDLWSSFLCADYSGAYIVDNLEQYRIENVVGQFLSLRY